MLKSFITFFLLLGAVSVSQADDKTPYQFAAQNSDGVIAWENEHNSGAEENTFSNSAVQNDGRDCNALKYDVTLFTPCEGEDSARLWRQTKIMFVAGFGQMDMISPSEDINKNMLNAGAGLYYRMTPAWSLRTDVRIYANTNHEYKDNALTLTLGYRFNGGERGD